MSTGILPAERLDALIGELWAAGYTVIGPVREGGALLYDEVRGSEDLPVGLVDRQEGGRYFLEPSGDGRFFGHTVAATPWKRFLDPPRRRLWRAERRNGQLHFLVETEEEVRFAFLGVRACDLHGIRIRSAVAEAGPEPDEALLDRRRSALMVAVQCTRAGGTCFCADLGTGPAVDLPADLVLTELLEDGPHRFLAESRTEAGAKILQRLSLGPAGEVDRAAAARAVAATRRTLAERSPRLEREGLRELLYRQLESPLWDEVAGRCLSCANCTLVCPTCFCSAVEDVTDLEGARLERWHRADSCFTAEFSQIHGGPVRASTRARYRQWLVHKLAYWSDQFGEPGCVGCGRCITWCPVGIDLTEVVRDLRRREAEESGERER
ncbi:MAG: 4Fe-4S ferredoxin [Porticoccaceae bacterium]|nr:MAG: 4Fe-4S ferredoxin [Porticoccaceae bacterium]